MYTIYFQDDKVLHIIGESERCDDREALLHLRHGDPDASAKLGEKLRNSNKIILKTLDPKAVFTGFWLEYEHIRAAGGLVRNRRGDMLMIFRNGRWDLPKGCMEAFESHEDCAAREVKEECGLKNVRVGERIYTTYHTYRRADGVGMMKETKWYEMTSDDTELTPQTEEGIEKAEWVSRRKAKRRLAKAYPMIAEIFKAADATGKEKQRYAEWNRY